MALVHAGQHFLAIESLHKTMAEQPSSIPYARAILGAEYIRTGQLRAAVDELEQASQLMPHEAGIQSNLALSLCMLGEFERAEEVVHRALILDPSMSQARSILEFVEARKDALNDPEP